MVVLVIKAVGSMTMALMDLAAHRTDRAVLEDTVLQVGDMVGRVALVVLEDLVDLVVMDLRVVGMEAASSVKEALVGMMIATSSVPGISFPLVIRDELF